jgi:Fe-S cluster assembly ATPase SufC
MVNGRIFQSGGPELAKMLEVKGYEWIERQAAPTAV